MDKTTAPATDLVELLSRLDDPRVVDGRRHRLGDILVIAFCTMLCGQEEFTAMARFGQQKEAWLRGFLELPGGIPSHDTFRAVLSALGRPATRADAHRLDRERARQAGWRDRGHRRQERAA